MHWATPLVIAWVIEIATIVVLIQGMIFIVRSANRIEENFKGPISSILITLVIFVLLGIFMGILVTKEISFDNILWMIPPVIGFFGAIILVKGGQKLFKELSKH